MKKKNWFVLPVVLMAALGLVFIGCGGGDDDPPPSGGATKWSTETVVTFDETYSVTQNAAGQNVYVIEGDALDKIKAAKKGAKLFVNYFTPTDAPGDNRSGYGMGFIGDINDIYKKYPIKANAGAAKGSPFKSESIEVSWALNGIKDNDPADKLYITIGTANQDTITGVDLYKPNKNTSAKAIPKPVTPSQSVAKEGFVSEDISYFGGDSPDVFNGKGDIVGADFEKIKQAYTDYPTHAFLRVYVIDCTAQSGYGVGRVGEVDGVDPSGQMFNTGGQPAFYADVYLSNVLGATWWQSSWTKININIWSGKVTKVELFTPDPNSNIELPEVEVKLEVNQSYGYQGFWIGLMPNGVKAGEEYTLTAKISVDKAIDNNGLEFFLVDEPWAEKSNRSNKVAGPIVADEKKDINFVFTANSDSAENAYTRIAISWGQSPNPAGAEPTVAVWEYTFAKTKEAPTGPAYTETESLFANGTWSASLINSYVSNKEASTDDGYSVITMTAATGDNSAGYEIDTATGARQCFWFGDTTVDATGSTLLVLEFEDVNGIAGSYTGMVYTAPDQWTTNKYTNSNSYDTDLRGMGNTIVYKFSDMQYAEYAKDGLAIDATMLSGVSVMAYHGKIRITKIYLANPAP